MSGAVLITGRSPERADPTRLPSRWMRSRLGRRYRFIVARQWSTRSRQSERAVAARWTVKQCRVVVAPRFIAEELVRGRASSLTAARSAASSASPARSSCIAANASCREPKRNFKPLPIRWINDLGPPARGFHDYFNDRWYEFTGVPLAYRRRRLERDLPPSMIRSAHGSGGATASATGENYEIEYRYVTVRATIRWVSAGQPVRERAVPFCAVVTAVYRYFTKSKWRRTAPTCMGRDEPPCQKHAWPWSM